VTGTLGCDCLVCTSKMDLTYVHWGRDNGVVSFVHVRALR